MKHFHWTSSLLIFASFLFIPVSCCSNTTIEKPPITITSTVTNSDKYITISQYDSLQQEFATFKENSESEINTYRARIAQMEQTIAIMEKELSHFQQTDNIAEQTSQQTKLRNPSWLELRQFLLDDDTDTIPYNKLTFDCSGYALNLRDRARKLGIRTAYVEVELEGSSGHALNAFETDANQLVYVDVTEADKIAYVQKGYPYGTVSLESIRERYISCNVAPDMFWTPLTYTSVANPFTYSYYTDYVKRWEFYHSTIDAFNREVEKFNNRSSELSISQMEAWKANIEALEAELGHVFYEPMGEVLNIELYWGENL